MDSNTQLGEIVPDGPSRVPQRQLLEWHSLTITRSSDGWTTAVHSHLDLPTRRLVTVGLPAPLEATPGYPWHVIALLAAAEELEARHRGDHGL